MSLFLSQRILKRASCASHARAAEQRVFNLIDRIYDEEIRQACLIHWSTAYTRFTSQCRDAIPAPRNYNMIKYTINEFYNTMLTIESELSMYTQAS